MGLPWTETLTCLALGVGLSACTGLRAWLPFFLAGVLARGGVLELAPSFAFLASNRALILFGIATLIEISGDKIPAVDHFLDALSTVIRPAAGAVLATAVLAPISNPLVAWVVGVAVGVPSSLLPHLAKSALRAGSTAFTAGLANPLLSVLEDAATIALFILTVLLPFLAATLVIAGAVVVIRRVRRRHATGLEATSS